MQFISDQISWNTIYKYMCTAVRGIMNEIDNVVIELKTVHKYDYNVLLSMIKNIKSQKYF